MIIIIMFCFFFLLFLFLIDGYSMADIIYVWAQGKNSVKMSQGLELPQFKVVGHKQSMKIETLSTGMIYTQRLSSI